MLWSAILLYSKSDSSKHFSGVSLNLFPKKLVYGTVKLSLSETPAHIKRQTVKQKNKVKTPA